MSSAADTNTTEESSIAPLVKELSAALARDTPATNQSERGGLVEPPYDLDVDAFATIVPSSKRQKGLSEVHATALKDACEVMRDTKSHVSRLVTPQGTFIIRNRYNAAELTAAMALLSCPYVCRYHAVVVDGNRDAGLVPVGFIVEDMGDLSLTQWMQRAKADKEKEAKQQQGKPNTGAASISLDAALVGVMRDVLSGVAAVHAAGYAYGGVNASNVKVTTCGAAKLTVPSQSGGAAAAEADVRSLAALLQHCIDTLQLDDSAVAAWRPLLDALGAEVAVTPSAALALLPASPTVADAFFSQALMCIAGGMAGLPEDSRESIKLPVAVSDVALRCSLTCLSLVTFLGKLTAAQRAVSLQWARTTADVIVRFISDGGVGAQLPARAEAKDKALLAAIDVLLSLNTASDNLVADALLQTMIQNASHAADVTLAARRARVLRQLGRFDECSHALDAHLASMQESSANARTTPGYAAIVLEKIKLYTATKQTAALVTAIEACDLDSIHASYRLAAICAVGRARLLFRHNYSHALFAARLFHEAALYLAATPAGAITPWHAFCLADGAMASHQRADEDSVKMALGQYQRALVVLQGKLDPSHPAIVRTLSNSAKAMSSFESGDALKQALKTLEQAREIANRFYGENHPIALAATVARADIIQARGREKDIKKAMNLYDRVIPRYQEIGDYESWAATLCTKANAYLRLKDGAKPAMELYSKVLLMSVPPSVLADACCGMAAALSDDGTQTERKLEFIDRAAAHYKEANNNHGAAQILLTKARILEQREQWSDVVKTYSDVIAIEVSQIEAYHPDVASKMIMSLHGNKANALQQLGDRQSLEEANKLYEGVYLARVETFGEEHPSTLSTLANQASALQKMGDGDSLQRALDKYDKVILAQTKQLGADHLDVVLSLSNKAAALMKSSDASRVVEAARLFTQVLGARRTALGYDHPLVVASISNLTIALRQCGDRDSLSRADRLYDEILARYDKAPLDSPQGSTYLTAAMNKASGLLALNAASRAKEFCATLSRRLPAGHPMLQEIASLERRADAQPQASPLPVD